MKFQRGSYGSVSFVVKGCTVKAFLPENTANGWCLVVGTNVYAGFETRRAAVEGVSNFI